jgi:hypothetical protein
MWLRESARAAEHARNVTLAARPLRAIKYHGKWPFTRLVGMQVRFPAVHGRALGLHKGQTAG